MSIRPRQADGRFLQVETDDGAGESVLSREALENAAEVVDTALFRSYLVIAPSLVGSLVRIENRCSAAVVTAELSSRKRGTVSGNQKYTELIDFYQGKKLHRQALELIERLSLKDKLDDFKGLEFLAAYLARLNADHADLIFAYARQVLEADEALGLSIFARNLDNADSVPRHRVVDYLCGIRTSLGIQYLAHIIYERHDQTPAFHERLAECYIGELESNCFAEPTRTDLRRLLEFSRQYHAEKLISLMPPSLLIEQTILLSRLGAHRKALEIYALELKDYALAEEYCEKTAKEQSFQNLFEIYITSSASEPHLLEQAIALLCKHGRDVDARLALDKMSSSIQADTLYSFFEDHLRMLTSEIKMAMMLGALRRVDILKTDMALLRLKDNSFAVQENSVCTQCHRRLGQSAIAALPGGRIVHYACVNH